MWKASLVVVCFLSDLLMVSLFRAIEILCGTLISHLSLGECALHACKNLPACASIMQTFVVGHEHLSNLVLSLLPLLNFENAHIVWIVVYLKYCVCVAGVATDVALPCHFLHMVSHYLSCLPFYPGHCGSFAYPPYPRHVLALASYPLQYNIKGFCDALHSTLADSLKLGIHSVEYCKYLDQGCWHEHLIFQIVPLDEKSLKEHRYIEVQWVTIVGMTGATRIMDRVIVYGQNRPSIDPDFDKSLATIIWPNKSDLPNIIVVFDNIHLLVE
ncbi:hypothetical protein L210DRAFT_3503856 [Boletus edulis BED1]|uniref:Uncharacterized protein n=1 Tax=Boletus edulis BED1 TaxID=1328754 RepID=A0AAD4BW87_BOLED|nr:hypothetical protein L210DRAFT_3503856 [Boletus edulis BED1]